MGLMTIKNSVPRNHSMGRRSREPSPSATRTRTRKSSEARSSLSASLKSPSSSTWDSSATRLPGQTPAHDGQHPHPVHAQRVEVRLESPFKADVYFVNTRLSPATSGARPIHHERDPDFGIVRVRLTHVRFPCREPAGVSARGRRHDDHVRLDELPTLCARASSACSATPALFEVPVWTPRPRYPGTGRGAHR